MIYKFYDLPYSYDALEPHIDAQTMEIHYDKHHRTYYDKMEAALSNSEASIMDIDRLFGSISNMGPLVRNNAGGYHNHNIFWNSMSPNGGGTPTGSVGSEIDRAYGSFDEFWEELGNAAVNRFGSGFTWLIVQNRKLKIVSTPNQDNPLMDVVADECRGTPILALDVWEHAYYLKYQNRRPDYIKAFRNLVNWKAVNDNFEKIMSNND